LYKIIDVINPEIIFEELFQNFIECYVDRIGDKLGTNTIIKYLENHQIEHIPVDCADIPSFSFLDLHKFMHYKLERRSYRQVVDIKSDYTALYGFKYLNSINYIKLNDWYENEIVKIIKFINDESLMPVNQKWLDFMATKEDVMISQIYDYCKNHLFERGLF
jgi:hypothetical protein